MNKIYKKHYFIVSIFLILLPFILQLGLSPSVSNGVRIEDGKAINITLPYLMPGSKNDKSLVDYSFTIKRSFFDIPAIYIKPDDCVTQLKINNKEINLSDYEGDKCFPKVLNIWLGSDLLIGENKIELSILNKGYDYGINVMPVKFLEGALYMCVLLISLYWAFILIKADVIAFIITVVGLGVLSIHLWTVDLYNNPLDVPDHLATIKYYASNFKMPNVAFGNESHQAPLYYFIAGIVRYLSLLVGDDSFRPILLLTFLSFVITLLYSVRLIMVILPVGILRYISIIAVVLWPANFIHCCRISNDIPFYAVTAIAVYYLVRWFKYENPKDFACTLLITALAFLIKSSAIILIAFLVITVLLKIIACSGLKPLLDGLPTTKKLAFFVCVLLACASFNFMRIAYTNYIENRDLSMLIGGTRGWASGSSARISIATANYITFDYNRFIKNPFWSYFDASSDREYFWNLYLKSYLYSMFTYPSVNIASGMNILLLLAYIHLIVMLRNYYISGARQIGVVDLLLSYKLIILTAMISMQIMYPEPGYSDTRHTYPTVLLFIILYALTSQQFQVSKTRNIIFITLMLAIVILGVTLNMV